MKLVIFDLDGTLLNTIADLAMSVNHALEQCGYPTHDEETYKHFVGNGVEKLFERALPQGEQSPENVQRIKAYFMPFYTAHGSDFTRPYDGMPALLEKLKAAGYKLAVASNKYQVGTEAMVAKHFPNIAFDAVLGQREGIPVKPHPQVVYDVLEITGAEKKNTIYVGDSDVDMMTAQNAHVRSVGVTWGFRTRNELIVHGAGQIVDTWQELQNVLMP